MLFTTPGNKIITWKDTKTSSRSLNITTSSPIKISVGLKRIELRTLQLQTKLNSLFKIMQEAFDRLPMDGCGVMHILGEFVNCEGDIRTSK